MQRKMMQIELEELYTGRKCHEWIGESYAIEDEEVGLTFVVENEFELSKNGEVIDPTRDWLRIDDAAGYHGHTLAYAIFGELTHNLCPGEKMLFEIKRPEEAKHVLFVIYERPDKIPEIIKRLESWSCTSVLYHKIIPGSHSENLGTTYLVTPFVERVWDEGLVSRERGIFRSPTREERHDPWKKREYERARACMDGRWATFRYETPTKDRIIEHYRQREQRREEQYWARLKMLEESRDNRKRFMPRLASLERRLREAVRDSIAYGLPEEDVRYKMKFHDDHFIYTRRNSERWEIYSGYYNRADVDKAEKEVGREIGGLYWQIEQS